MTIEQGTALVQAGTAVVVMLVTLYLVKRDRDRDRHDEEREGREQRREEARLAEQRVSQVVLLDVATVYGEVLLARGGIVVEVVNDSDSRPVVGLTITVSAAKPDDALGVIKQGFGNLSPKGHRIDKIEAGLDWFDHGTLIPDAITIEVASRGLQGQEVLQYWRWRPHLPEDDPLHLSPTAATVETGVPGQPRRDLY